MNVPNLASQILADIWEYGRVVMILVAFMAVYGFIIDKKHVQEQSNAQGGLILIALGTVGVFALFSFLNVQGGNLLALMKDSPVWGFFTSAVVLSLVVISGITAYRYLVAGRTEKAITITGPSEQMPQRTVTNTIKLSWLIVLLLLFASVIWLWRLAGG
jgi:acyl-coenzyme A thioesterase PaaI-like protein